MMNSSRTLHIRGGEIPTAFAPGNSIVPLASSTPGFRHAETLIRDGMIVGVEPAIEDVDATILDASGCLVLPGFVDVHVHGAVGYDTMDASVDGLVAMAQFYAQHGVTGFLATTMTAPHADLVKAVGAVAACSPTPPNGARILGVHLEGSFISPAYPGAQKAADIRKPDLEEFEELISTGPVRMITLAPEQPGAHALIRMAVDNGVTVVAGHTNATYDEFQTGVEAGISQATHTYNAMSPLHHRRPGTLGAVLSDDRVYAQLIADNIHVHPAAMCILSRCKSVDRTVLITDAMRAAGMEPGEYDLGGQPVTVNDGSCRLADGTLAGSILTLELGLANYMAATEFSIDHAWPTVSRTPATSIGMNDRFGSIAAGYQGDLTIVDHELNVVATVVDGKVVYLREPDRYTG